MRTLLLNASYEPLAVVSWRRAVLLVLEEKADVLAETGAEVRSPSRTLAMPSVIKLRGFVKVPYRARLPLTREHLLARDQHRCAYCGARATTIDHVHPRSKGGEHRWENVVAACRGCNGRKGDRLLSELGWTLRVTPRAPHGVRWLIVGVATVDPAWEPFLTEHARMSSDAAGGAASAVLQPA